MNIIKKIKKKGIKTTLLFVIMNPTYLIIKTILKPFFKNTKINEKIIVFSSNPDFSDNAKVLYNYYRKQEKYKDYKYVWLISRQSNIKKYYEKNTIFIKSNSLYYKGNSLKAMYYTSIAKIIYFTHGSPASGLKKKNNQLVINLWHGCGYKNIQQQKKSFIQENPFDYALVPGKVFVKTKSIFWGCDKKQILTLGYPRYDLLFEENETTKNYVNQLKHNNKLIVWMPTFRKTGNNYYPEEKVETNYDIPLLKSEKELTELNQVCKENNVTICIKRHPMQLNYESERLELSNIVFIDNNDLVENNIDLYSLLKYTDGLITDYSSVAIDYILLDKPIAFTLDDFEKYNNTRGFVFDNPKKYMPGHHIYNYNDILQFILDISNNIDMYTKDRGKIVEDIHNKCNNYCKRIVKETEKLIEVE